MTSSSSLLDTVYHHHYYYYTVSGKSSWRRNSVVVVVVVVVIVVVIEHSVSLLLLLPQPLQHCYCYCYCYCYYYYYYYYYYYHHHHYNTISTSTTTNRPGCCVVNSELGFFKGTGSLALASGDGATGRDEDEGKPSVSAALRPRGTAAAVDAGFLLDLTCFEVVTSSSSEPGGISGNRVRGERDLAAEAERFLPVYKHTCSYRN